MITRITGHLVFKIRADITKRALVKMNLQNIYKLYWGGVEIIGRECI